MKEIRINTALHNENTKHLKVGDMVYLSGTIYTGRDAAHKRMLECLQKNEKMPFPFEGNIIFYAGPCPNKPGHIIGSIGPTTSGRMDAYSPTLIQQGLKFMIGKGLRNEEVKKSIVENKGIYFIAIGGAAALISKTIKKVDVVAYEDLGTEAIRKLEVIDFPLIVALDSYGGDIYS